MKKRFHILLFFALTAAACTKDRASDEPQPESDICEGIYVALPTRADKNWTIEDEYAWLNEYGVQRGENEELPYITDEFQEGDILYISQLGTTVNPVLHYNSNGETSATLGASFSKETEKDNLYIYQYKKNPDADWDEGYNFVPYVNEKGRTSPIKWSEIRGRGSVGNSFSLYAVYDYQRENPSFGIRQWENQRASARALAGEFDVMAAYHATSSLYTRMRFRLHHLVNCLHVTLLVPTYEWDEEKGKGTGFNDQVFGKNDGDHKKAGGSQSEDLPGVWLSVPMWVQNKTALGKNKVGIKEAYEINWRASISSDHDTPALTIPTGGYRNNDDNPCLYKLEGVSRDPFTLTNVRKFYPESERETDEVRRFEFVGYYLGQDFNTNNPFLSIRMLTPGSSGELTTSHAGGTTQSMAGDYVPYFFWPNKDQFGMQEDGTSDNDFHYGNVRGVYQHLILYVTRRENEAILVSAKMMPWKETSTEITLVEDEDGGAA